MYNEKKPKHIPRKLQDDVAKKYQLKIIRPGLFDFGKFGKFDLRKIDLKKADKLVEKGFPYLVPVKTKTKDTEKK